MPPKSKNIVVKGPSGPPPSYPQETDPVHVNFLSRSLRRCDVELAALNELHGMLRKVQKQITQTYGVETLLDLGEGRIALSLDGQTVSGIMDNEDDAVNVGKRNLCRDFLSRMKLRRKLLNRLARRLNRVSHAMDGASVAPPVPPKFGDDRFVIDPAQVTALLERRGVVEAAKDRIRRQKKAMLLATQQLDAPPKSEEPTPESTTQTDTEMKEGDKAAPEIKEKTEDETKEKDLDESTEEATKEVGDSTTEGKEDTKMAPEEKPDATTVTEETKDSEKITEKEPVVESAKKAEQLQDGDSAEAKPNAEEKLDEETVTAPETETEKEETSISKTIKNEEQVSAVEPVVSEATGPKTPALVPQIATEQDYELVKEYEDRYEKLLYPTSKKVEYKILEGIEDEEEEENLPVGGIGSTHRSMTSRDKSIELRRWQTDILARIPDQPTFEDLGMDNRLFYSTERRTHLQTDTESGEKTKDEANESSDASIGKINKMSENKSTEDSKLSVTDKGEADDSSDADSTPEEETDSQDAATDTAATDSQEDDTTRDVEMEDATKETKDKEKTKSAERVSNLLGYDSDDDSGESSDTGIKKSKEESTKKEDPGGTKTDHDVDESENKSKRKAESMTVKKEKDDDSVASSPGSKTDADDERSDDVEGKDKEESLLPPPKKIKPFGLAPVPTFAEQDMKRIRMVHSDVLSTSVHEYSRRKITETTMEYNQAFRMSHTLVDQRNKIQADMSKLVYQYRLTISKRKNDYALEVAISKAQWQKRKDAWEAQRGIQRRQQQFYGQQSLGLAGHPAGMDNRSIVKRSLNDIVDRINCKLTPPQLAIGTPNTLSTSMKPYPIEAAVGASMAHMVDAVEGRVKSNWINDTMNTAAPGPVISGPEEFEPFVPPASQEDFVVNPSTGETLSQLNERLEGDLRSNLGIVMSKLQSSEEERLRAWRKMLKTKAELEPPHSNGRWGRTQLTKTQMEQLPLPQIKGTAAPPMMYATPRQEMQYVPQATMQQLQRGHQAMQRKEAAAAVALANQVARIPTAQYMPVPAPTGTPAHKGPLTPNTSDSKYSAARVKERIFSDGSVVPVTMPKQNKDGLYQRPAGRKRKNMKWDAVRGRWMPLAPGEVDIWD